MADEKTWLTEAATTEQVEELGGDDLSARPADTPLRQQRKKFCGHIPHYLDDDYEDEACEWTSCRVGCVFLISGTVCILLSVLMLQSSDIETISHQYDNIDCSNNLCSLTIPVVKDMPFPLRLGFELTEFFQNNRVNVGSRSPPQMRGTDLLDTSKCKPTKTLIDPGRPDDGKVIYPCGLTSQSIFTDRFTFSVTRGSESFHICPPPPHGLCPRTIDEVINHPNGTSFWDMFEHPGSFEKAGAWDDDIGYKYAEPTDLAQLAQTTKKSMMLTQNLQNETLRNAGIIELPDVTDVDLMVWMRIPVKEDWKKPHRVIRSFRDWDGFRAGDTLQVKVFKLYHTGPGERHVFIETSPKIGDTKSFLVALFLVTGGCSILFWIFTILPVFSEGKFRLQIFAPGSDRN